MRIDLRKIYSFSAVHRPAGAALPAGAGIYYECGQCGQIISSVPFIPAACDCGNLTGRSGKVAIQDPAKVKCLHGKLR